MERETRPHSKGEGGGEKGEDEKRERIIGQERLWTVTLNRTKGMRWVPGINLPLWPMPMLKRRSGRLCGKGQTGQV